MFPENRLLEILIIGAVALIVVGPKDLPILMRRVGQWVGKMRSMAAEFRASFDELARQSELDELRKEVEAMRADPRHYSHFDPAPQAATPDTGFTPAEALAPAQATALDAPPAPKPAKPRRPRAKKTAGGTE